MSCHNLSVALRIKGLTLVERAVLHFLCDRERKGKCWPSVEEICWEYGLSRRAVLAAIGRLRSGQDKHGNTIPGPFIRVDVRYKQASVYHLLPFADPPRFKEVCGASHAPEMGATNAPEQSFSGAPDAPECGAPDAPENDIWGANFDISGVHDVHPESPKEESPKKEKQSASPPTRVRARTRGEPLPEDWQPNDTERQHAIDKNVDPDLAADEFRNHWCGEGGLKRDWQRTFHNRVLWLADRGTFRLRRDVSRGGEQLSQHDRIRREGNLPTHFGHFDDEPGTVVPMRRALA